MLRFEAPIFLILFIPLIIMSFYQSRRTLIPVIEYSDVRLLQDLPASWRIRLRRVPNFLRILAFSLVIIALCQPQSGTEIITIDGSGVDIVAVMDVSDSMGTADFEGMSRLRAGQSLLSEFIINRPFDRIGLVGFSSDAYYISPPTLDHQTLLNLINQLQFGVTIGLDNQSAIGVGIVAAINMLRPSEAQSKVILLLTDGANNTGVIDPLTASQLAQSFGIRIYTVGIGDASQGNLDEITLQQIAINANGQYFNALSLDDLQPIYTTIADNALTPFTRIFQIDWANQAHYFVLLGLIMLMAERYLRLTIFQSVP